MWILGVASGVRAEPGVPILLYHRFGPTVADRMTVTTAVFESHLKYLRDNGYAVIPLRELLAMVASRRIPAAGRTVALAADDGHISVYAAAFPLLKKYDVPMTLFLYPSAISNASYAMTWEQLRELKSSGLFDFQSHTYWHPNFNQERKRLSAAEFEKLVELQLTKSRQKLEKELGVQVDLLAWPFGIYDPWLMEKAAAAGYRAAFSIDRHAVRERDPPMALPRFLMTDQDRGRAFAAIVDSGHCVAKRESRDGKNN